VFVPGKPFLPSLVFTGKARAHLSEAPFGCFALGQTPGIAHKYTSLGRPARYKHCSLLWKFLNTGRKKFYRIGPRLLHRAEIVMDHLHWQTLRDNACDNVGDSDTNCTCLGHLWSSDINRNSPICVATPKVAKASKQGQSLLPVLSC